MSLLVWSAALLLAAPAAPAAVVGSPLALEQALAAARPGPAELAAQAELARTRHLAAATAGRLADGWSLAFSGGPRRAEDDSGTDLAAEIEVPLLAGGDARAELLRHLARVEELLPRAAQAETREALAASYAEAWAAQEIETLRAEALGAADAWLAQARSRVDAGAEAPFEADLVVLERQRAATALRAARAARLVAWGALAAAATLPEEPVPLAAPPVSAPPDAGSARRQLPSALALHAVDARAALARSALDLQRTRDESRWSLRSTLGREGEEEVAHVGVAYRMPRANERELAQRAVEAERDAVTRDAELARAGLFSRLESALVEAGGEPADLAVDSITRTRGALTARLLEGKSRPSEVLPLRLQLLAAEEAAIERRATLARATATLERLLTEVQP